MQVAKNKMIFMTLMALALKIFIGNLGVFAATATVVINEVAWAGTQESANDEWIELYNASSSAIDLSGWQIDDDNGASTYTIESGEIAAHGYFVIEDSEPALSNYTANAVINISLANNGDSLFLKNNLGEIVDRVNSSGLAWAAGNGTSKASMERIDPAASGDNVSNWADALSGNGTLGRSNNPVLGTPGTMNSNFVGANTEINLTADHSEIAKDSYVNFLAELSGADDVYGYGLEITYDSSLMNFVSAEEKGFLKTENVQTIFDAALKDGQEGVLIIAGSRIGADSGAEGDGELFDLKFKVVGETGKKIDLGFSANSFVSDSSGDIPTKFKAGTVNIVATAQANPVTNLAAELGSDRYSFNLSWSAPVSGADKYFVFRKNSHGDFEKITETTSLNFIDDGSILVDVDYIYRVVALKGDLQSEYAETQISETRGLKGDNNRSDLVDGRDLNRLAKKYGAKFGEEKYDALLDGNFDGVIDGSDLIDIGINFGKTYK